MGSLAVIDIRAKTRLDSQADTTFQGTPVVTGGLLLLLLAFTTCTVFVRKPGPFNPFKSESIHSLPDTSWLAFDVEKRMSLTAGSHGACTSFRCGA